MLRDGPKRRASPEKNSDPRALAGGGWNSDRARRWREDPDPSWDISTAISGVLLPPPADDPSSDKEAYLPRILLFLIAWITNEMSEKLSTIILKVDLQCVKCSKKIKDTLSNNLQDRYNIRSITYDEKNNSVSISGHFDPKKLIKKICCKACKVILDIHIVVDTPKQPDPPPPDPEPAPVPEPVPPAPEPEPAPPAPEPAPPAPEPEPEPPKQDPPQKDEPVPPAPEPVAKPPEPACPNPAWGPGPGCCCWRPWYEAYHGGCRCCTCGCVYGQVNRCPPPPPPAVYIYGGPCYDGPKTCEFIYEEQPAACAIM